MGYYRGVPHKNRRDPKRRLDEIAAKMRAKYLTSGTGCKSTAKAIAARLAREIPQTEVRESC